MLSSSNTFTGGVTLQDGLVRISNANALGATSGTLTFANGGLSSNSATAYGIANP
ncbi:MAG: autotransporter, partial [bacterium]